MTKFDDSDELHASLCNAFSQITKKEKSCFCSKFTNVFRFFL